VLVELESVFQAPVIEAYGMTEAAHQIASNSLPAAWPAALGERKAGSVGVAAGPQVAVMDEAGHLLPAGVTGEIVIRGANVMARYENNPTANESAFTDGWFRTGDRGRLDADGYLFLTGRLKEIINRGGEKISPREIDELLLEHPAIREAVTFAVPHPRLGEEVAAAVVLREGAAATEREIRAFVAGHLADFKVPRQVLIVNEIPKGPTGKLQRIGLAQKLGVTAVADELVQPQEEFTAPRTPTEAKLAAIWRQVLGIEAVSIHDPFFHLGGDSILATQLIARVRDAMQVELPLLCLFDEAPTVAGMAGLIETIGQAAPSQPAPLLQTVAADGGALVPRPAPADESGSQLSRVAPSRWPPQCRSPGSQSQ
jgi:acyl carrier protein